MQEVKVIQRWDGNRPAVNYVLRDFRRFLIQKRIDGSNLSISSKQGASTTVYSKIRTIAWIEKLLSTPLEDYRKYCIWRILCPYLINVRKLSFENATVILEAWLQKCDNLRRTDFDHLQQIKNGLKHTGSYLPPSKEKIKQDCPKLYKLLHL
ncbi:MAG: DNA primase noncatalytic subunit PriX [Candidatus Nitrosocosmicus sp.]|nr:DNA primase noncatalytic subunit PriX [Candidatus Nitrosocosmicus sp.]